MVTHPEIEFFRALSGYITERYQTESPTMEALEGMIMGFLAGSEYQRMDLELLSMTFEMYPRTEGTKHPYQTIHELTKKLQKRTPEIRKPCRTESY